VCNERDSAHPIKNENKRMKKKNERIRSGHAGTWGKTESMIEAKNSLFILQRRIAT
jgi:hypothetical protein